MITVVAIMIGIITAVIVIGGAVGIWLCIELIHRCFEKIWEMWKEM